MDLESLNIKLSKPDTRTTNKRQAEGPLQHTTAIPEEAKLIERDKKAQPCDSHTRQ
jgi:hypothetical protein